jgi:hypothetical protein
MSEQQISKLAGTFVEHQQHLAQLPPEHRQWAIQNMKEAIAFFCDAVKNRAAKSTAKLLEPFGTPFTVPDTKQFAAKKAFVVDTSKRARVRISWLGNNFRQWMLPKVERDLAESELRFSKLTEDSLNPPVITELGDRAEISLHAFYETLAHKQQIRDFAWLVAYVRDAEDELWAVGAHWLGDGWRVLAYSVGGPNGWGTGLELVSR